MLDTLPFARPSSTTRDKEGRDRPGTLVRVLLVHNYYQQRGGEDVAVEQELELLRGKGHTVELFSVHNDVIRGLWRKAATAARVVYNAAAKAELARKIAAFRPDVVHVHNFFPLLSPSVFDACREAGVPSVMTLHNFRILCPTATLFHDGRIVERSLTQSSLWALPQRVYQGSLLATAPLVAMIEYHKRAGTWRDKVDLFIALTDFAKAKLVEGGLPAEKIVVRGNAAADPLAGRASSGAARHGALYVGRLSPEKGIASLLAAWEGVDYPLRIVGDGPLRDMCERARGKNVVCVGRLDREGVTAEMQRAAFLVLPSVCYEMFPMTLVEAYANGLPVLGSRLGGLADLLQDGVTGVAFAPGDAADLRAKVSWAAAHRDEMARMGARGRAAYETRYTIEKNYAALMAIYDRVVRGR